MATKPRKNGKVNFSVRIRPEVIDQVKFDAERHGLQLGDYVEMVLLRRGLANMDYFAQQAAFQSFVSAAMVIRLSQKAFNRDEMQQAKKFAYEAAATLFGQPPIRPGAIGDYNDDLDPRLSALFDAFAGE